MIFKYKLDQSSKKFSCPSCGKRTFVRYVSNETGHYLNNGIGRCDRESKCKYHYAPPKGKKYCLITFLSIQTISEKSFKATESNGHLHFIPKSQVLEMKGNSCWITEWWLKANNIAYLGEEGRYLVSEDQIGGAVAPAAISAVAFQEPKKKKISFHSFKLMDQMYNEHPIEDNLRRYLKSIFSDDQVFSSMQNYFLTGTNLCWKNATVFWQIDDKGKLHAGKIMLYNPSTGKRIKKPYNHINWIHKALKEPEYNLNQCLFGLHRIQEDHNKAVAIVESEKTAIIMSIIVPEVLWLATGSKQNLKPILLEPLIGRKIVLYPDKGECEDWRSKAEIIRKYGFRVEVSDIVESSPLDLGSDLVDYYLANITENVGNAENEVFK